MPESPISRTLCDCELRNRAWNPNTRRCEFCHRPFEPTPVTAPAKPTDPIWSVKSRRLPITCPSCDHEFPVARAITETFTGEEVYDLVKSLDRSLDDAEITALLAEYFARRCLLDSRTDATTNTPASRMLVAAQAWARADRAADDRAAEIAGIERAILNIERPVPAALVTAKERASEALRDACQAEATAEHAFREAARALLDKETE